MSYSKVITLNQLREGMVLAESVYVLSRTGTNMLLVRKNTPVDKRIIQLITRYNVQKMEVYSAEAPKTIEPDRGLAETPVASVQPTSREPQPDGPVKRIISDDLRREATESIQNMFVSFHEPGGVINLTTAFRVVSGFESALAQVVAAVTHDIDDFVHINDIKSYDEYTYHHSLSVALLAVATGQAMGMELKQLLNLGRCAMLHDVGKQFIPIETVNKPGRLTPKEFIAIQEHPVRGSHSIRQKAFGDVELWLGIMFHHEKLNGRGYPKKLQKADIPLFSRIIAVADVYDALTSHRPYRKPMTPTQAYEMIASEVGSSFDHDVFAAFAKRLTLYPINTTIEMADGRRGFVVGEENALRPVVKLFDGEILDLGHIDNLHLSIAQVINPNDMPK